MRGLFHEQPLNLSVMFCGGHALGELWSLMSVFFLVFVFSLCIEFALTLDGPYCVLLMRRVKKNIVCSKATGKKVKRA